MPTFLLSDPGGEYLTDTGGALLITDELLMSFTYVAPIWYWRARDCRLIAGTGQAGTCVRAATATVTDMLGNTATLVNNQMRLQAIDTNADSINDSLVFEGAAATTDYLKWTVPTQPIAATYYVRLVNRGSPGASMVILEQGFSAAPAAYLLKSTTNTYHFEHDNGVSGVASISAAATSGQTLDLRGVLRQTGVAQLYISTNGGAEVASAATASLALAAAWSDTILALCGGVAGNSCNDDIFAAGIWLGEQSLANCQAML